MKKERKYTCTYCGCSCDSAGKLLKHIKKFHKPRLTQA